MFWDKIIAPKFHIKSEVCGLEACFREEGRIFHFSHLKQKNNKLELVKTGSCIDKPDLPEVILKNKVPLMLVLNGKVVILKKISLNQDAPQEIAELIHYHLPAINRNDFYTQVYRQEDQSGFIALCRKEVVDALISELKAGKYELAGVLLGVPSVIGLQPLWSDFNTVPASTHRAELSNNVLDSVTANTVEEQETLNLEGLSFSASYTLGFSAGLSYLMQRKIAGSDAEELYSLEKQHMEKNKFRFLAVLAVGIAFFAAIVNVLFYTSCFDQNNRLEAELSVYQGKYEQINELLSDYQKNKNLIEDAGVLNKSRLSEYADRIGKTLPDEVILSDLYFNPRKEEEENSDSLVTFENRNLILKGNCSKSFIVNEWINVLKMQRFIKEVSLEKFIYNNQGLLPNFEIRVVTE